MRRKRVDGFAGVPSKLREYRAAEWVSFDAWRAARSEWADAHGWPGGPLARIREDRAVRLELSGRPQHQDRAR